MQKKTPPGHWIEEVLQIYLCWEHYSPKVTRAKFLGSNRLFCFISICKFDSFKNPFITITSLSELYFRIRRLILFVRTKKVIFINYGSSTSSWKPWKWKRLSLIISMSDIYINSNLKPLTRFTSRSRSTEFKDILLWIISQMITKTIAVSKIVVIAMQWNRVSRYEFFFRKR